MGIDYTFRLVYGFEMDQETVENHFLRSETENVEGVFHMEDRWDPKTGVKLEPVKIWDVKPKTKVKKYYLIDDVKYDDLDPEEWESLLEEKFGCYVEVFGSFPSGELTYVFYVNKPIKWQDGTDYGKVTIYNDSLTHTEIINLMPEATALKKKLEDYNFNPGEPRIFIAQRIS